MESFLDGTRPIERTRGRKLPHWFQPGVTVYETIRLADSLPASVMRPWRLRRDGWLRHAGLDPEAGDWRERFLELPGDLRRAFHAEFSEGMEQLLDRGHGACLLRESEIAAALEGAIRHFDGVRYDLGELAIAGNHAHALATPRPGFSIRKEATGWKRWTTQEIHRIRGTGGRIWQAEGYDRLVRSPARLLYIQNYIKNHTR